MKKASAFQQMLSVRMRMSGLEPMTPCMSSRYSNQLSYTLTTESIIAHFLPFVNPYFEKIGKIFRGCKTGTGTVSEPDAFC